jgi:FXSXX-COOH protein
MSGDIRAESALADLTNVPLARLRTLDNSVFVTSIRRLLAEVDDPPEAIAGFQSSIDAISSWQQD